MEHERGGFLPRSVTALRRMRARYCRAASVNRRFLVGQYFAFAFPIRACAASGAHAGQYTFPWSHGLQISTLRRHFRQTNDRQVAQTVSILPAGGGQRGFRVRRCPDGRSSKPEVPARGRPAVTRRSPACGLHNATASGRSPRASSRDRLSGSFGLAIRDRREQSQLTRHARATCGGNDEVGGSGSVAGGDPLGVAVKC